MTGVIFVLVIEPQSHSKFVADTIGEHLRGLLDDQMICLLQSFIYPKKMMIERPEDPPVLDENAQRFTFTKDFQVVPLQQQGVGKQRDPIFELFNPPADAKEGRFACSLKKPSHNNISNAIIMYTNIILCISRSVGNSTAPCLGQHGGSSACMSSSIKPLVVPLVCSK